MGIYLFIFQTKIMPHLVYRKNKLKTISFEFKIIKNKFIKFAILERSNEFVFNSLIVTIKKKYDLLD